MSDVFLSLVCVFSCILFLGTPSLQVTLKELFILSFGSVVANSSIFYDLYSLPRWLYHVFPGLLELHGVEWPKDDTFLLMS
jgi:hypothetical protein